MRAFRLLYRKLGRRYPRAALGLELLASLPVVAGGVALLFFYLDLSVGDFFIVLGFEWCLIAVESVFAYRLVSRLIRPADPWLRGDRSPEAATAAWQALASVPGVWTRSWKLYPIVFNGIPFCVFATWLLELPWWAFFALMCGAFVTLIYGLFLRFFVAELILRPVVEDVAGDIPDDVPMVSAGITLRYRLLIGLPVLNIITGSLVAGVSQEGGSDIADLGFDVLIAVAIAFTIAFELSLLLTRSIVRPIDDLRRATARVAEGDLEARVPVTSTDEIGMLANSFNRMLAGLREREKLREAFGAYVDPQVAERVLAEGPSLEGEEVEVTLLFLDIRGFTAYAERSSAREVVAELNAFYDLVVPVLVAHGGQANKFVGDGLLGVFGAPHPATDHADRAVAAALAIRDAVTERYRGRLRIGIGVNSGPVVAGSIGGGGRVEFTVIGDPVNTAYRVEGETRRTGDEILITDATRCLLTRDFGTWEPRPPVALKGKRDPATLYAPGGSGDASTLLTGESQPEPLPH